MDSCLTVEEWTEPATTALATATAAVAVITLGNDEEEDDGIAMGVTTGILSFVGVGAMAVLGNGNLVGASLLSNRCRISFFAGLSCSELQLEPVEIAESGEVGLPCGDDLTSSLPYFGGRPETH